MIYSPILTMSGIPRPALWYRADYRNYEDAGGLIPVEHGSPVGRLVDVSGTGGNIVQPELNLCPTWREGELDGYPAIQGDGVDDVLPYSLSMPSGPRTVIYVGTRTNNNAGFAFINFGSGYYSGSLHLRPDVGWRIAGSGGEYYRDLGNKFGVGTYLLSILRCNPDFSITEWSNGIREDWGAEGRIAWSGFSANTIAAFRRPPGSPGVTMPSTFKFIELPYWYNYPLSDSQVVKLLKFYQKKYPSLNIQIPEVIA